MRIGESISLGAFARDREVLRAFSAWQTKEAHEWMVARAAWYVVGGRTSLTTAEFAAALGVSAQMVRRWKRAWDMYDYLSKAWGDGYSDYPHPRQLRKRLTIEHFVELMEAQGKHRYHPYELFSTLDTCANERISAAAMRIMLEEEATGNATQPAWWRYLNTLADTAVKLAGEKNVPAQVAAASSRYLEMVRPYLEQGVRGW